MLAREAHPSCRIFEPYADFDRLLNAEAKKAVSSRKRSLFNLFLKEAVHAEPKDVDPEGKLGARRQLSG
jgi:hypothetical protein